MTLIAITPGEPAGIGPDILIKLVQYELPVSLCVIIDRDLLKNRADMLGLSIPRNLSIQHVPLRKSCIAGIPDPANAVYVLETLKIAVKGCQSGDFEAMVTGPVSKFLINKAGIPFTGHTEWLAAITGTKQTVMLFVADALKVALYTTHIPLSQVSSSIHASTLKNCIQILHHGLQKYFSIKNPNIIVCGLNPHAGEQGYLGKEEITTIGPVIDALKAEGLQLNGPLPADTVFTPINIKSFDAILALYHDQGLPFVKASSFGHAVNITFGLPFIRTSVDHGTAFDLAGTNLADEKSLLAAVKLASKIALSGTKD
ncbi:4-hydroxythreonine-4-phosphate dehydrogenase PdxA [Coxiella endosymbiont of Amblyomma nuttalli]|uniref:4-hydroxythreonine-4-phosphate dehydrogenase PdxA n=1 Tax=Coxiella endosymbiont of Amblyomma nuttalli TaxID=2749996 RepID=UPI001BA6ACA9|nr:4-hydroxythreonine-4-phosphate dehydrogenase PdxA [Coxiella endosymbiont of Amblyomma nuttalli]QTS83584.1 4-hydroxythreonine-4-phosphate dehydrogenase [Coxiella endosymbiont of Amblyomma nuttalli]